MSSLEETPGPEMGVSDKGYKMCSVGGGAQDEGWETLH